MVFSNWFRPDLALLSKHRRGFDKICAGPNDCLLRSKNRDVTETDGESYDRNTKKTFGRAQKKAPRTNE